MYDAKIIHRDIKLENIFLSRKDLTITNPDNEDIIFKYGDFGFARFVEANEVGASRCGTPRYLAPEILFRTLGGDRLQYRHGPDMWAIGVVLYRCLTGTFPFTDDEIANSSAFDSKLSKLSHLFPEGTDEELKNLILSLLTKDTGLRMSAL